MGKIKPAYAAIGIAIIILGAFLFIFKSRGSLLGEDLILVVYQLNGQTSGGSLSIPFERQTDELWFGHALVDLNRNGQFEENEAVVSNQRFFIKEDYRNNFTLSLGNLEPSEGETFPVSVALTKEKLSQPWDGNKPADGHFIEAVATVKMDELGDIVGLDVPGASEDLKRGPTGIMASLVKTAQAQGEPTIEAFSELDFPDLPQGNMECGAVSAANGLTGLAEAHGQTSRLPGSARELIDELKNDMNWNNGILNNNFLAGKNTFVQRHNLPIVTEMVEAPSLQQIADAVQNGCAVEMSMVWLNSRSGLPNTGHTVLAVGAYAEGAANNQIAVHDSASRSAEGAEVLNSSATVRFRGRDYIGVDYPGWDGVAFVDAIFIQCWSQPQKAETGSQTAGGEETSRIEVLVINNKFYPKSQFKVAQPDACNAPHYHASGTVYGLAAADSAEIVTATDPNNNGCGFGTISEVPVRFIDVTYEQSQALIRSAP